MRYIDCFEVFPAADPNIWDFLCSYTYIFTLKWCANYMFSNLCMNIPQEPYNISNISLRPNYPLMGSRRFFSLPVTAVWLTQSLVPWYVFEKACASRLHALCKTLQPLEYEMGWNLTGLDLDLASLTANESQIEKVAEGWRPTGKQD